MVVEPTQCDCGLLYCPDVSGDVRRHKRQHDEWANGVKAAATTRSQQVIGEHQGYRSAFAYADAADEDHEFGLHAYYVVCPGFAEAINDAVPFS